MCLLCGYVVRNLLSFSTQLIETSQKHKPFNERRNFRDHKHLADGKMGSGSGNSKQKKIEQLKTNNEIIEGLTFYVFNFKTVLWLARSEMGVQTQNFSNPNKSHWRFGNELEIVCFPFKYFKQFVSSLLQGHEALLVACLLRWYASMCRLILIFFFKFLLWILT